MKAKKLILQAFGPYKDRIEIDFEVFGNDIYLISGDTGSGKTTIFDAISYALFDKSSGGKRSSKMFRSTFVNDGVNTEVEFSFEYLDEIYTVSRINKYKADNRTEKVSLHLPNGDIIEGKKIVNKKIEELIGLTDTQFKQIVMIAQGDFYRLIHSNSDDNRELFRKIFSTYRFKNLEDKFQELSNKFQNEYKDLEKEFNLINKDLPIYENTELIEWYNFEELKLNLDFWLEQKKIEIGNFDKRLKYLDKSLNESAIFKSNVENYFENKRKIEEFKSELIKTEKKFEYYTNEILKISEKEKEKVDILEENTNLRNSIKELEAVGKLKENLEKLRKELFDTEQKKLESVENFEKIKIIFEESFNFLEKNKNLENEILENNFILEKLNKKLRVFNNLEDKFKLLEDYDSKLILLKEDFEKIQNSVLSLEMKKITMEDLYFKAQAGILALKLKENEPCMVCGSFNHPQKAKLKNDVPDKKDIDKILKDIDVLKKERETKVIYIEKIKSVISENKKYIENIISENDLSKEYNKTNLEKDITILNNQQVFESNKKSKLITLKHNFEKQKELNSTCKSEMDRCFEKITNLSQILISLNEKVRIEDKRIQDILSELEFSEKNLVEKKILENEKIIDRLGFEIETIRENYNNSKIKKETLIASIETLSLGLDEKYNVDLKKINEDILSIKSQKDDLLSNIKNENLLFKNALNNKKKVSETYEKIKKVSEKLQDYKDIYNTLNGKIKGKDSIRFETYIQMRYFEEVISRANRRFIDITDGKFMLQRKKISDNNTIQFGLDLEVFDTNSGKTRDIKTLSGGESFEASLSLALGLSETIQMYSGGIEIENLFIDEGFGTLDKNLLDKVMKSLFKLSELNKSIGIISHVDKLKESIDKKIVVEKSIDGTSKIKIEV